VYGLSFLFEKPHCFMFSKKHEILVPLLRAKNGLKFIQIGKPNKLLATRDVVSGKQINWKSADPERHIADTCTLVCKKRTRSGKANSAACTCFMDYEETGCDTQERCHPVVSAFASPRGRAGVLLFHSVKARNRKD